MAVNTCPQCGSPNRDSARFCANCGEPLLLGVSPSMRSVGGPSTLPLGSELQGRYRIEYELGRGGFGAVYRAFDNNLNKYVAIKENLDTSPEAQRQFAREATVLANLSHPHLPRVTDHFTIPGQGQYLVMDFVEGEDLSSLQQKQVTIPVKQAVQWILQVAEALIYLHAQNPPVVHRDIKPANIRITPDGRATLVDFGLVKVYDPHLRTTLGARAVTPGYAPPEQYGQGTTDPRTDIYALGATFYNLLTGHEPPESVSRVAVDELEPVEKINPQVHPVLARIIQKCMALRPAQRYQSMEEFKNDVNAFLSSPQDATVMVPAQEAVARPHVAVPSASEYPQGKKKRNWAAWVFGSAAVIVLIVLAVVYAMMQSVISDEEFQQTVEARVKATRTAKARMTATPGAYLDSDENSGITEADIVWVWTEQGKIENRVDGSPMRVASSFSSDGTWLVIAGLSADINGDEKISQVDCTDLFIMSVDDNVVLWLIDSLLANGYAPYWNAHSGKIEYFKWRGSCGQSRKITFVNLGD